MPIQPNPPHTQRELGFAMVEVLVTLLLMSIGLLGMAGLLNASLQANKNSHNFSVAGQLLQDMSDRIRANPSPYDLVSDLPTDASYYTRTCTYSDTTFTPKTTPDKACGGSSDCAPRALADSDLAQWLFLVNTQLPNAGAEISGSHIGPIMVTVYWTESTGKATTDNAQQTAINTSPCLTNAQKTSNTGLVTTVRNANTVTRALTMQVVP